MNKMQSVGEDFTDWAELVCRLNEWLLHSEINIHCDNQTLNELRQNNRLRYALRRKVSGYAKWVQSVGWSDCRTFHFKGGISLQIWFSWHTKKLYVRFMNLSPS